MHAKTSVYKHINTSLKKLVYFDCIRSQVQPTGSFCVTGASLVVVCGLSCPVARGILVP